MIASSSDEQPTPVEVYETSSARYLPVMVNQVEVQVGIGSPILVEISASGTWPGLCSQVTTAESKTDEFNIDITLSPR